MTRRKKRGLSNLICLVVVLYILEDKNCWKYLKFQLQSLSFTADTPVFGIINVLYMWHPVVLQYCNIQKLLSVKPQLHLNNRLHVYKSDVFQHMISRFQGQNDYKKTHVSHIKIVNTNQTHIFSRLLCLLEL